MTAHAPPPPQGLYDPRHEHDACGFGFVCDIQGRKSHAIVRDALRVLVNLEHRGASGSEKNTGDGAGLLTQIPHAFLERAAGEAGIGLGGPRGYGVGMVFLPQAAESREACARIFERVLEEEGLSLLGWRQVPTDNAPLGSTAKASQPFITQVFVARPEA